MDALLLLGHATAWPRTTLLAHPEWSVEDGPRARFNELVGRRAAAEPIFYLVGEREFYGRDFNVDRRALIPRPETEVLVEIGCEAVTRLRGRGIEQPVVVELGTGCGPVSISLAAESEARILATDLSWEALTLARENAAKLGQTERIAFIQANLLNGIRGPIHLLLANLPYVPRGRVIPPDVLDYEPNLAIFAGERGTELVEQVLRDARPLLAPGGEVAIELDESDQAEPISALARELYPAAQVLIRQDGGGYDRVIWVRLPERGA